MVFETTAYAIPPLRLSGVLYGKTGDLSSHDSISIGLQVGGSDYWR